MKLVTDAKQFIREMGRALESSVLRIRAAEPEKQLLLASQIVGNCDMLIGVLRFLGETAPRQFERFANSAIPHVEKIKRTAMAIRAHAFRAVFEEVEPADVVQGVPPDAQPAQQGDAPYDPHAENQPAYPPPEAPSEFRREPTNPGVGG